MATRGKPQTKEAKLLDMLYGKPAAGDLRNTQMLKQTGEGSYLRQQYPEVYGGGAGLLGIAPDELGGSVLDPNTARVRQGAEYGFPVGTAAQIAPLAGPALKGAKMTGKALGAGLNEAIYHGAESPLSKFIPEAVKPLNVVKPKGGGGNWFNVEKNTESLKQPLFPGRLPVGNDAASIAETLGVTPEEIIAQASPSSKAINNWVNNKLNKYIKNEMGTPDDPVRKLAEQGKLHFEPDVSNSMRLRAQQHRGLAGYPTEGSAGSQLAADWEALTDAQIQGGKARNSTVWPDPSIKAEAGAGSWIHKVDPDADVYKFGTSYQPTKMLGFDHIVDELRNATTLGDNLPKVLQIDPKKLEQMSVSDVVNHVSKINEWRANQAARAHDEMIKVLEKSPVTSVMKEYPDGYKWVELKLPDNDPKYADDLAKALKLEGDSMGHCVGGYCPDVMAGRSRVFSLRDPKGRAHATIEAMPDNGTPYDKWVKEAPEAEKTAFGDYLSKNGMYDFDVAFSDWAKSVGKTIDTDPVYNILQIKGKGNARPIEKYDPYTQDFVINNDWHIVDEAYNAGLRDTSYELAPTLQYAEGLGLKLPRFVPDKDYQQLIRHMDETLESGIPTQTPDALKKYIPVEAAPAPAPLPAPTPEPVTNPFWYNPKSKQLEAFDVENTHTKSLMDPDYATKLGVAPLDPNSLNMEHGSLLMGRTEKTAPNTLNLMQVDEFTTESLSSIQAMLNEKNLPHEKFSLSGGSSLYENVPAEAIRGAKTLEDLKKFRIGGEEPPAYAAGGSVIPPDDFTTPDMSDGSGFFTDPDFARFVMEQPR